MQSRSRVLIALASALPLALAALTAEQAIRSYPAEDGFVLENGELLGGDFIAFYVGGRLFEEERDRLYDLGHQREVRTEFLGPANAAVEGELPFVYPPLVAAMVVPLSRLPFQEAFLVWSLIGTLVSLAGLVLLAKGSGASEQVPMPILLIFIVGFVPYSVNAVFGGQAAWVGITLLSLVSVAVLGEKDVMAGAAMSLSYYKPPLFVLLFLSLAFGRKRRFLAGFGGGAALLIGLTWASVGTEGLIEYWGTASRYVYGRDVLAGVQLPPSEGMGIVALGVSLLPSASWVLVILAVPFFLVTALGARLLADGRRDARHLGLLLSVTASVAFSLQAIKYDLALLLVPIVLVVPWYARKRTAAGLVTLLALAGFYLEFTLREVRIAGEAVNLSWLLFVILVGLLGWLGWRKTQRNGNGAEDVAAPAASPGGPEVRDLPGRQPPEPI